MDIDEHKMLSRFKSKGTRGMSDLSLYLKDKVKLISDLWIIDDAIPEILYHYTNARGLLGIIESEDLWLTHSMYLNDLSEIKYACYVITKAIKEYSSKNKAFVVKEIMDICLDRFEGYYKDFSCYMFSFCEDGNLLGQWRSYGEGGGGFALGFNFDGLPKEWPFVLKKVIYSEEKQVAIINTIIDAGLGYFYQNNLVDEITVQSYDEFLPIIKSTTKFILWNLLECLLSFKHPCFHEEKEWRLVFVGEMPGSKDTMDPTTVCFREVNNRLIPFVKLCQVNPEETKLPLEMVIVGPTANSELASQSTLMLLRKHNYKGYLEVSGLPIRP